MQPTLSDLRCCTWRRQPTRHCMHAALQKDPMTQEEIEDLVLKLNKIEVRLLQDTRGR